MVLIHFIITIILFSIHAGLGILYLFIIGVYYALKSSGKKKSQIQSNPSSSTQTYRQQPQSTTTNNLVIETTRTTPQFGSGSFNNGYNYTPLVVTRLKLAGDDKKFMLRLWSRHTNFLAITQCEDETTKLYLSTTNNLREYASSPYCSEAVKVFLQRLFTERQPTFFDSDFYTKKTQVFVNNIYKLSEIVIRKKYHLNRKLDEEYYTNGLRSIVDEDTVKYIKSKLYIFEPEVPTNQTKQQITNLTPSAWKEELKLLRGRIRESGYNKAIEKEISAIIDANEFNPSFKDICFEVCRLIADYNREEALVYYMLYKGQQIAKSQKFEELPPITKKIIFKDDEERYQIFLSLPLEETIFELRLKIQDLFMVKRREIVIDAEVVAQKRELDGQVVSEINKILTEEGKEMITDKVDSLDDIFSASEPQEEVHFKDLHKSFLQQFITANYQLPRKHVDNFGQKNNIFPSMLINEINEAFYEVYEDNLILEGENMYTISEHYRSTIQQT